LAQAVLTGVEDAPKLGKGHFFHIVQPENKAVQRPQSFESLQKTPVFAGCHRFVMGIGDLTVNVGIERGFLGSAAAAIIDAGGKGDPENPGLEGCPFPQGSEVAERLQKNILAQVFRFLLQPDKVANGHPYQSVIPVEENLKLASVTCQDQINQFGIGRPRSGGGADPLGGPSARRIPGEFVHGQD
jgi:hypothetical protein